MSALSIPEKGRELQPAVSSPKLWPFQKATATPPRCALRERSTIDESLAVITKRPRATTPTKRCATPSTPSTAAERAPRRPAHRRVPPVPHGQGRNAGELPPEGGHLRLASACAEQAPSVRADGTARQEAPQVLRPGRVHPTLRPPNLQGEFDEGVSSPRSRWSRTGSRNGDRGEGVFLRFREDVVRPWEESAPLSSRGNRAGAPASS